MLRVNGFSEITSRFASPVLVITSRFISVLVITSRIISVLVITSRFISVLVGSMCVLRRQFVRKEDISTESNIRVFGSIYCGQEVLTPLDGANR